MPEGIADGMRVNARDGNVSVVFSSPAQVAAKQDAA